MDNKMKITTVFALALGLLLAPITAVRAADDDDDDTQELTFMLDDGEFASSDDEIDLQTDLYPDGLTVYFTGKKMKTEKALAVRVKKVDGDYEVVLKESETSSNYAGLKLSYNRKKGTIKGSFKVYGVKEYETKKGTTKMKLKKYTVKIKGSFNGSEGSGTASSKQLGKATFTLD